MLKIVNTKWRPFIELTEVAFRPVAPESPVPNELVETGMKYHLNVLHVPDGIVTGEHYTALIYDNFQILVKESAEEIYATVDKMVEEEADRKAAQAAEYMAATQKRAADFAKENVKE